MTYRCEEILLEAIDLVDATILKIEDLRLNPGNLSDDSINMLMDHQMECLRDFMGCVRDEANHLQRTTTKDKIRKIFERK